MTRGGDFYLPSLPLFKIIVFPFDALRRPLLFCSFLPFLKFLIFPFDALGPRGGPYFLPLQKVGKDRRKGVSPPCESPDQSGVLDAPLWKPPSLAALSGLAELLAACAAGASVPLGKARARARPPRLPHLHRFGFGGFAPLPPAFPVRGRLLSCAPAFGASPPCPLRSPEGGRLPAKEKQRTKTCAVFCLSFIPFKEKAYPARRAR